MPKVASERAACSREGFSRWRKVLFIFDLDASLGLAVLFLAESLCL
jgi:hypothetical protein